MDIDHIPPNHWNDVPWWEFEEYVKRLNDRIERENKQQKDSQSQQNSQKMPNIPNMSSIMNNLGKYKP